MNTIRALAATLAFGATLIGGGTALADHGHYLITPGTCVEDIGSGQTSIADPDAGGYHQFHAHVHKGQPGTVAFQIDSNPAYVDKVGSGPGCPAE